jgi:hypothetical protein
VSAFETYPGAFHVVARIFRGSLFGKQSLSLGSPFGPFQECRERLHVVPELPLLALYREQPRVGDLQLPLDGRDLFGRKLGWVAVLQATSFASRQESWPSMSGDLTRFDRESSTPNSRKWRND